MFFTHYKAGIPDFLNSVSAIVGRYRDELTHITAPVSFAQKLQMLEGVFAYYLTGTANIRNSGAEQDYLFELLLAGYDLDGTPKVGRLILGTAPDLAQRGQVWTPVTYEREVFPITPERAIFLNGKPVVAKQILENPKPWRADPAIAAYDDRACVLRDVKENMGAVLGRVHCDLGDALTMNQMKDLAISLKQHTADRDPEVGGPSQIALLIDGRVRPIEAPSFPAIALTPFQYHIIFTITFDNSGLPGKPVGLAVAFEINVETERLQET